jgi:hypothetical protein
MASTETEWVDLSNEAEWTENGHGQARVERLAKEPSRQRRAQQLAEWSVHKAKVQALEAKWKATWNKEAKEEQE